MNSGTGGSKSSASRRGTPVFYHVRRFLRHAFQLFVHDDIPQILENSFLRNVGQWTRIFTGSVWSFRGPAQHDNMYRPLQFITYWALYRLKGPDPVVFHLFLLLFYAATVWLVFRLACQMLPNSAVAFVGALLWALHPLHVEPAAWVSALPDLGAAFFYLLGFLLFVRAERSVDRPLGSHILAAAGFFPALFFKEMALSFPLIILAYWFFFPGKQSWKSKSLHWIIYASAVLVYLAVRIAVLGRFSEAPHFFQVSWRMATAAVGFTGPARQTLLLARPPFDIPRLRFGGECAFAVAGGRAGSFGGRAFPSQAGTCFGIPHCLVDGDAGALPGFSPGELGCGGSLLVAADRGPLLGPRQLRFGLAPTPPARLPKPFLPSLGAGNRDGSVDGPGCASVRSLAR